MGCYIEEYFSLSQLSRPSEVMVHQGPLTFVKPFSAMLAYRQAVNVHHQNKNSGQDLVCNPPELITICLSDSPVLLPAHQFECIEQNIFLGRPENNFTIGGLSITCVTVAYAKLTTLKLVDFTLQVTKIDFSGKVFDLFSYFKKDNEPR